MAESTRLASVVVTVFNEVATISSLLDALLNQTVSPAEIVIVDGGSTDLTRDVIQAYQKQFSNWKIRLHLHRGNISEGRNEAVRHARHAWLAITDAGCVPEPTWLEELFTAQEHTKAKAVAGFYKGSPKNSFEAATIPFSLVMPDQLSVDTFLPASRSLLIARSAFQQLAGFDEKLVVSEDYDFAHRFIARFGHQALAVAPQAVVAWQPRSTLVGFAWMIARQAEWDVRARRWRIKVGLVWGRYLLAASLMVGFLVGEDVLAKLLLVAGSTYLFWAVLKNFKYAPKSWFWLPLLQLVADLAVMTGSGKGVVELLWHRTN